MSALLSDVVRGGRWDKSLGVLCQKFVMLFLIAPVSLTTRATRTHTHWDNHYVDTLPFIFQNQEVTLECAGSVLMPEGSEDPANPFAPLQPTNSKSKKEYGHTHTQE